MMTEKQAAIVARAEGMITRGQASEIAFKIRAADSDGAYGRIAMVLSAARGGGHQGG